MPKPKQYYIDKDLLLTILKLYTWVVENVIPGNKVDFNLTMASLMAYAVANHHPEGYKQLRRYDLSVLRARQIFKGYVEIDTSDLIKIMSEAMKRFEKKTTTKIPLATLAFLKGENVIIPVHNGEDL